MKRAAVGALLISLVAGSTAMAGTVLGHRFDRDSHDGKRNEQQHRPDHRNEPRRDGRRDPDHRNDRRDDHRNDHRNDYRNDRRDDHRNDHRRDDHRFNHGHRNDRHWDNRHGYHHGRPSYRFENGRYHWGAYHRPHGYAHRHWNRGDRLPRVYYAPTYVIGNYYDCGLRRPPHGHHWVRVNNDAVLAVIATGVVLDVVFNQFW